ncbi:MAG: ankyrin repeat domain-containing protein [Desulfobacterales bacterium]
MNQKRCGRECRDINGATPLFIAAALNDESIVQYLIEKGADVDAAIESDYEYNGQPICKGATPLMAALKMAQNANAALLVNSGADVNARCEDGTDALMIAALNADAKMANFLLAHGATHQTRTRKIPC